MASLATKIVAGFSLFVAVPVASTAVYQKLTETSLTQQALSSDFQITVPTDNSSELNKTIIVANFVVNSNSFKRTWSCEIRGVYSGSDDDWSSAKEVLKTEIENRLNKLGKYEDKVGFINSCSYNKTVKTRLELVSVVSIEYEKSGDTWKFKSEELNKLLSGELRGSSQK